MKSGTLFNKLPASLIRAFHDKDITEREGEVLYLAAQGWGNKGIANLLDISVRTVEVHRFKAQPKIGADTIAGTVRFVFTAAPELVRASRALPELDI